MTTLSELLAEAMIEFEGQRVMVGHTGTEWIAQIGESSSTSDVGPEQALQQVVKYVRHKEYVRAATPFIHTGGTINLRVSLIDYDWREVNRVYQQRAVRGRK